MKLAYAINTKLPLKRERNVVMYAFSTSAETPSKSLYEEEVKFVHYLCEVLGRIGFTLLIKPKPNTKISELNFFKSYPHVRILSYQVNGGGSAYDLSESYNIKRLKELDLCDFIITAGTTFAFDTAAYGLPVLQFIFISSKEFPNLSNLVFSPHITKHIFSKRELLAEITDKDTVQNQINGIFKDPETLSKAVKFRDYLRDWLIPGESINESVTRVIDEILEED